MMMAPRITTSSTNFLSSRSRYSYCFCLIALLVLVSEYRFVVVVHSLSTTTTTLSLSHHNNNKENNNPDVTALDIHSDSVNDDLTTRTMISRRNMMMTTCLGVVSSSALFLGASAANAAVSDITDEKKVTTIKTDSYSFTIPSSWTITSSSKNNNDNGLLFSSIDLQGGATLTVVREQACSPKQYFEQPKVCDLSLTAQGSPPFADEAVWNKDAEKLLARRDDREQTNKILGAPPSILESITSLPNNNNTMIEIVAKTEIPTGAPPKKDVLGRITQDTIIRIAKARVAVLQTTTTSTNNDNNDNNTTTATSLVSIWLNAPLDEWQKPVSGIRLQQVLQSIQIITN